MTEQKLSSSPADHSPKHERRRTDRRPIEEDIVYRVHLGDDEFQSGRGRTQNMSSTGVLFSTEQRLPRAAQIQLVIEWLVELDESVPLVLTMVGRIVRSDEQTAAVEVESCEFRVPGMQDQAAANCVM